MTRLVELHEFVKTALECSVYIAPTRPGLTHKELYEVGQRFEFQEGEIRDVIHMSAAPQSFGDERLLPRQESLRSDFHIVEDPDYRDLDAFDFACRQLQELARTMGAARAQLDHTVLVERAVASGIQRNAVETAIVFLIYSGHFVKKGGTLSFAQGRERYPLPSEQAQAGAQMRGAAKIKKPVRAKVYPEVRDVIERRSDGRASSAEALDAFADALDALGYGPFRLWWKQTVSELRRLEPSLMPVSVAVLSAALIEGALTFVVKHARDKGLGVFQSTTFKDKKPHQWSIDDLLKSAARGGESAILDNSASHRADELTTVRQRIHAGRMLSDHPDGVPDLRPEEARDALQTVDLIVRRVLDWLQKYPPNTD